MRRTAVCPLPPVDAELITAWAASLWAGGYATSSVDRAVKRLRSFARRLPDGLLKATRKEVVAFFQDREVAVRQRESRQRAAGLSLTPVAFARHPTWVAFVIQAKNFYVWAERQGLVSHAVNPVRGIRQYPPVRTGVMVQPKWYCRMLHHPSLNYREGALLWLLAHGLTPSEVLRLAPGDVDLKAQEVHVRGPQRARVVPLSARAVARLTPWVRKQQWLGRRWLFPSGHGRPLSDRTLRDIVARVARRVFPGPSQANIRRGIYPLGFRHTFVVLALRGRVSADCVIGLTGITRAKLLTTYLGQTAPPERLREELRRITRRSRNWI